MMKNSDNEIITQISKKFIEFKEDKIFKIFDETNLKQLTVVYDFICMMCYNNKEATVKMLYPIDKGLKDFDCSKFRNYLFLLYKMALIKDDMQLFRLKKIVATLKAGYFAN